MKKVVIQAQTHLEIDGAKVDCPKEYIDRTVYLVII